MIYEHEFEILGNPKGKERPRMARGGHVYTPKTTKDYEKLVSQAYFSSGGAPLPYDSPISLMIVACMGIPKADKKALKQAKLSQKVPCFKKPDIDNIAKIIMDGLQGEKNAFCDDTQVVSVTTSKEWSETPKVKVKLFATITEDEKDEV